MTHEAVRGDLPDAPEGAFDYLAGLTEETDISINDRHFKICGGVGRRIAGTGEIVTSFSLCYRVRKGVYREVGAGITQHNKVDGTSSTIDAGEGLDRQPGEPPDIDQMLQDLKGLLSPSRKIKSVVYKTNPRTPATMLKPLDS